MIHNFIVLAWLCRLFFSLSSLVSLAVCGNSKERFVIDQLLFFLLSLKTSCYNSTLVTWSLAVQLLLAKYPCCPGTKMRRFLSFLVTTPFSNMDLVHYSTTLLRIWILSFSMKWDHKLQPSLHLVACVASVLWCKTSWELARWVVMREKGRNSPLSFHYSCRFAAHSTARKPTKTANYTGLKTSQCFIFFDYCHWRFYWAVAFSEEITLFHRIIVKKVKDINSPDSQGYIVYNVFVICGRFSGILLYLVCTSQMNLILLGKVYKQAYDPGN